MRKSDRMSYAKWGILFAGKRILLLLPTFVDCQAIDEWKWEEKKIHEALNYKCRIIKFLTVYRSARRAAKSLLWVIYGDCTDGDENVTENIEAKRNTTLLLVLAYLTWPKLVSIRDWTIWTGIESTIDQRVPLTILNGCRCSTRINKEYT